MIIMPASSSQDVSTRILSSLDQTTTQSLTSSLTTSWLSELNDSTYETKRQIHDRIHSDLPNFTRQFESSKLVQTRLSVLSTHVDNLNHEISNDETGLIPVFVRTLSAHHALSQEAANASSISTALSILNTCYRTIGDFGALTDKGELPQAMKVSAEIEKLLDDLPDYFQRAKITAELRSKYRIMCDRAEEQLSDAYKRGISISSTEFSINPAVQVRGSKTVLELRSILNSLPPASLERHLQSLRRDLTSQYIEPISSQSATVAISPPKSASSLSSGTVPMTLNLYPTPPSASPPEPEPSISIANLSTLLRFLSNYFFPLLHPSTLDHFQKALIKPLSSAVLNNTLLPALPTALSNVPPFLKLCEQAVKFEGDVIEGILAASRAQDSDIRQWVTDVPGHVERKRRIEILDNARGIIMRAATDGAAGETFTAEKPVENLATVMNGVVPEVGSAPVEETSFPQANSAHDESKPGVGLGITQVNGTDKDSVVDEEEMGEIPDEDAWGLDDDEGFGEDTPEEKNAANSNGHAPESSKAGPSNGHAHTSITPSRPKADDSADAWGFDDQEEAEPEESWPEGNVNGNAGEDEVGWDDDPWGEAENNAEPTAPSTTTHTKVHANGQSNGFYNGDVAANGHLSSKLTEKKPTGLHVDPVPVETYSVSTRVREIVALVKSTLDEGRALADSRLFIRFLSSMALSSANGHQSSFTQGSLLTASASSILDLYRALYPVAFMQVLQGSSAKAMQFSNDCGYIHAEMSKLGPSPSSDASWERFTDSTERLKVLSESWYIDTVERQKEHLKKFVDFADGLTDSADDDRFNELESTFAQILRDIRVVAQQWKNVLARSKYLYTIGILVESVLSRILEDVLALDDIPEVESHRLSELCKILSALEGLFVQDPDEPSLVVTYVPSWLKYSYLSELLEASLADISYLFNEGALVDFEVDELVKLLRALFADTPLRATTIEKVMRGHPKSPMDDSSP